MRSVLAINAAGQDIVHEGDVFTEGIRVVFDHDVPVLFEFEVETRAFETDIGKGVRRLHSKSACTRTRARGLTHVAFTHLAHCKHVR